MDKTKSIVRLAAVLLIITWFVCALTSCQGDNNLTTPSQPTPTADSTEVPTAAASPTADPYPAPATTEPPPYPYPEPTAAAETVPSFDPLLFGAWLPAVNNGLPCPQKHGLAYALGYHFDETPTELCLGHVHYWNSVSLDLTVPFQPFIWCKFPEPEETNNWRSSIHAAKTNLGADYAGDLYVGNEPDISEQCGRKLALFSGDANVIFAQFVREVQTTFPNARLFISHTSHLYFSSPSPFNGYSTVNMLEAYRSIYGDYPDLNGGGIGLHYGNPILATQAAAAWLDTQGLDYKIVYSEWQVCAEDQAGYDRVWEILDFFNGHPRIHAWEYYTDHLPADLNDPTVHARCTLYDWPLGGDDYLNARGRAYRDWGLAHRGE